MPKEKYTYLKLLKILQSENGRRMCIAVCTLCGNFIKTRITRVTNKEQLSCGCIASLKPAKEDVTGKMINGVTFIGYAEKSKWKVRYKCGHEGLSSIFSIKSCATGLCFYCYSKLPTTTSHGHAERCNHSGTYNSWLSMKRRCNDENNNRYEYYGNKGISYDTRWDDFKNFLEDMGERPANCSLERLNINKGYCKDNCTWVDAITQANNKSSNVYFKLKDGTIKTMAELSRQFNMDYKHVWYELKVNNKNPTDVFGTHVEYFNKY